MSLFDLLKSKKNEPNLERMVIGFWRTSTSKLLGIEVNTKEFFDAYQSAGEIMKITFIPLLDRQAQQGVVDTLASVSSKRFNELYGDYMMLLFVRYGVVLKEIEAGRISEEDATDATPDFFAGILHDQLKDFINQVK